MLKRILSAILICGVVLTSTACTDSNISAPEESSDGYQEVFTGDENLPSNNPYFTFGTDAIMKTENGYYFKQGESLLFHDNKADQNIYLCNRPECMHDGNQFCVATNYKVGRLNTFLYNGYIYMLGQETVDNVIHYKLLRADLYGGELSELCTYYKLVEEHEGIRTAHSITHKGKIFVTFKDEPGPLSDRKKEGTGLRIFMLDLEGGYKEIPIADTYNDKEVTYDSRRVCADGDGIYYLTTQTGKEFFLNRYDLVTGETKIAYTFDKRISSFVVNNDIVYYTSTVFTKENGTSYFSNYKYATYMTDLDSNETKAVFESPVYDKKVVGFESWGSAVEVTTDREYLYVCNTGTLSYLTTGNQVGFHILDLNGNKLASFDGNGQFDWDEKHKGYIFNVLDGVAYLRVYEEFQEFETYTCPVKDIIDGKEKWTRIFDYTVPQPPEEEEENDAEPEN